MHRPVAPAGIDRGQIEPEGVDHLPGQILDGIALAVGRVLGREQLQVDQLAQDAPDRPLGQAGAADQVVVGRPHQQPLPLLLAPAGDELGQHRALGRPQVEGLAGLPGGGR